MRAWAACGALAEASGGQKPRPMARTARAAMAMRSRVKSGAELDEGAGGEIDGDAHQLARAPRTPASQPGGRGRGACEFAPGAEHGGVDDLARRGCRSRPAAASMASRAAALRVPLASRLAGWVVEGVFEVGGGDADGLGESRLVVQAAGVLEWRALRVELERSGMRAAASMGVEVPAVAGCREAGLGRARRCGVVCPEVDACDGGGGGRRGRWRW